MALSDFLLQKKPKLTVFIKKIEDFLFFQSFLKKWHMQQVTFTLPCMLMQLASFAKLHLHQACCYMSCLPPPPSLSGPVSDHSKLFYFPTKWCHLKFKLNSNQLDVRWTKFWHSCTDRKSFLWKIEIMSLIGLQTAFKSWRFWPKTWRFWTVREKFLAQNMALSADFLALRPLENLVTLISSVFSIELYSIYVTITHWN